jgi:hypothetical protein
MNPPHGLKPGTITVKLPQLKHHEALVLSLLVDGERSTQEIKAALGWRIHPQGLVRFLRLFGEEGLIRHFHTSGRAKAENGQGHPFFSSVYAIAPKGRALLNESIDFYGGLRRWAKKAARVRPRKAVVTRRMAVEKKADTGRDRRVSVAELNRMSAAATPEFELVLRGLRAGLRIDEICALNVSDVHGTSDGHLTVRLPSGKLRELPVNAELREVLRDAIAARLHWRVFETARRKPWTDLTISLRVSQRLREIGIDDVQPCSVIGEVAWPTGGRARPHDWRTLDRGEWRKLLRKAPRDLELFVRACQHAGVAREKLRDLTWKSVGLDLNTLRVKADHLPEEYVKVLNDAAALRFSGPLFLTRTGKRWHRYLMTIAWPPLARKVRLPSEVKLFGRGRWGQWSGSLNLVGERPSKAGTPASADTDSRRAIGETDHVELFSDRTAVIDGSRVPKLTEPQYRVVSALISADDHRLLKDELFQQSEGADALNILRRLSRKPSWQNVIRFPRVKGDGYCIA